MKNKTIFFLLAAVVTIGLVINSCKKTKQSLEPLLTDGTWQLASVQVFNYVGSSQIGKTDTLNLNCDSLQHFTFSSDHTCTFTNFECIPQKTASTWSLSDDQLVLFSPMVCKDTLPGNIPSTGTPFNYTKIYALGLYSMTLQTGDVNTFFTPTTKRRIVQYGFVRQNTAK